MATYTFRLDATNVSPADWTRWCESAPPPWLHSYGDALKGGEHVIVRAPNLDEARRMLIAEMPQGMFIAEEMQC